MRTSLFALLVILENLITLSWWFFACTFQNLPGLPYIRPSSALTKELFCTQGRDFLCDRKIDELIERYPLALGCLASLLL